MNRQLTSASSLEGLKKEAKRWSKALRAGDPEARRRLESVHPRAPAMPGLRDVQHALAREHGLESWAALRTALEDLALARRSHAERVADFLDLACLHYGVAPGARRYSDYSDGPERRRQAARILARHPEVGRDSLHTAVVCGDRDAVAETLARRPEAAREKGGREGWEPLLFLCYGRLPVEAASIHAVEIATVLLDHGASPDSAWSYEWEGRPMTWSAFCGAVGEGENGPIIAPPHPQAAALASLLLERGADCNQSQALYNTMLRGDDDRWLRLLIAHGLSARHRLAWEAPDGETRVFDYLLEHAVGMNQLRRATLLLAHGANPHGLKDGGLYRRALLSGNGEMAALLERHGTKRVELTGRDAFRAACVRLDAPTARRLLAADPSCADEATLLLVDEACKRDLVDLARLLLDLGVSPDAERPGPAGPYRALHQAACADASAVATLLLERGAEVDARDVAHQSTPLGWALHTHQPAAIALFGAHTRDIFTVVAGGLAGPLHRLLSEDRSLANATVETTIGLGLLDAQPGETPLFVVPDDEECALEVAALLLACGADPSRRNHAGQTAAEKARARGLLDVGELLTEAEAARPRM